MAPELIDALVARLTAQALTAYDEVLEGIAKPTSSDRLRAMRAAVLAILEEQRKE